MKTFIKNIEGLNEYLGYSKESAYSFSGEEIGYGERAFIFKDVTELCGGESEAAKFDDFCVNAEIGTFINYKEKQLCKVMNSFGDAEIVYEDEKGVIHGLDF
jgi:hypothetical protein